MTARVELKHASAPAADPEAAARHLAALTGGVARPFPPCPSGWVCFLDGEGWEGAFIELYPRTVRLTHRDGVACFVEGEAHDAGGTHFNLVVPRSRATLERICEERGLPCSWRAWGNLLEVWLDDTLLVECVPRGDE